MRRNRWFVLVLALACVFCLSCQQATDTPDPEPEPEPEPEPVRETVVHVAGWSDTANGEAFPCYWKDGQLTVLSVCRLDGPIKAQAYAHSIFVSGSDVYAAGYGSCNYRYVASYWKNGKRTDLKHGSGHCHAKSIFVSGKDVYLAGCINFFNATVPCYWKNGVRTDLSRPGLKGSAEANAIFVVGSDVYVAGSSNIEVNMNMAIPVACYWKNGVRTDLSPFDPKRQAYGLSIFFSEGNVYVAGYVADLNYRAIPCYWTNGVRTELSRMDETKTGQANSIQVSEGGIYVAGQTQGEACEVIPCYWKNGTRTDLSVVSPGKGGMVNSIFVLGSDVFTAGYSGFDPNQGADFAVPCYWKNGERTDLDLGTYPGAFATGIWATYKE
jgi:hypothetical protein